MKKKVFKLITALISAAVMASYATTVFAETSTENNINNDIQAYLDYNPDINAYELTDQNGNIIDESLTYDTNDEISSTTEDEKTSETVTEVSESKVTTSITTSVATKTTTTSVTTTVVKVTRITVPPYVARYRKEAEEDGKLITNPVLVTSKTTTKNTTVTTKPVTTKLTYKGIDVSRHQGAINWQKVKAAGIDFVMIRAGYGMEYDQVDANFHSNIKAAQAAGIDCGVYWYSYALNTAEALKEAKVCYDTIKGYQLSYPVSFDIEDPTQTKLSTAAISNMIKVFGSYLEERKYYVSVYSYASFLNDKCDSSVFTNYDVWVAHTGVSKPSFNRSEYGMWQYSHTGRVNGISGNVDLNYAYKYYPGIMKKNKLNGYK